MQNWKIVVQHFFFLNAVPIDDDEKNKSFLSFNLLTFPEIFPTLEEKCKYKKIIE